MKIILEYYIISLVNLVLVATEILDETSKDYKETDNENTDLFNFNVIQIWTGHDLRLKCGQDDLNPNIFKMADIRWYFKPCNENSLQSSVCHQSIKDINNWIRLPCSLSSTNSCHQILTVRNTTQADTGIYKCTFLPHKFKDIKTVEIQVQTFYVDIKDYSEKSAIPVSEPPTFFENFSTNITTKIGSKIIFQCRVYSKLHTTIRWFRNIPSNQHHDHFLTDTNEYNQKLGNFKFDSLILEYFNKTYTNIESSAASAAEKIIAPNIYLSKLILDNVDENDSGNYACVAINIRGHSILETYLQVLHDIDNNSSLNVYSMKYLKLFLMPIGLALVPLPLWLIYLFYRRSSRKKLQTIACSYQYV